MQKMSASQNLTHLSPAEMSLFRRHMGFRLILCLWALYAVIYTPFAKALVTLFVIACFNGMGEVVFASLMGMARIKVRREEARKHQEALLKLREAKAAATTNYFEVGMEGQ